MRKLSRVVAARRERIGGAWRLHTPWQRDPLTSVGHRGLRLLSTTTLAREPSASPLALQALAGCAARRARYDRDRLYETCTKGPDSCRQSIPCTERSTPPSSDAR